MGSVADVLERLFREHGVRVGWGGRPPRSWLAQLFGATRPSRCDRLLFPDHPEFWAEGEARVLSGSHPLVVQTDVRFGLPDGRTLIESIIGVGDTSSAGAADGLNRFATASFHVLLAAFFGRPVDDIEPVEMDIGGRPRVVYRGPVLSRFAMPLLADGRADLGWLPGFEAAIAAQPLPAGDHWVRLYRMWADGQVAGIEVLVDNEPWPAVAALSPGFGWPTQPDRYDVRMFLVIRDRPA